MYIKDDYGFEDLKDAVWSGAKNTMEKVEAAGKEGLLMEHLEEIFFNEIPTITEVNDVLWHDHTELMDTLGIYDEEEEE